MGTYYTTDPATGAVARINIAGTEPTAQEQERISGWLASRAPAPPPAPIVAPEDYNPEGTALGRGFRSGLGMTQELYGSGLEGVGTGLGIEGLMDFGAAQREAGEARQAGIDRIGRKEVDGAGEGLSFVGELAGEQAPVMAGPLAGAALGAGIGSFLGPAGTVGGGILGGAAGSFPLLFGGMREEQRDVSGTIDEGTAALAAVPATLLDLILPTIVAKNLRFVKPGSNRGANAARGVAEGALTEVPTEIAQEFIQITQAGGDPTSPEAIDRYIDAGIAAGIIGGGVGGAGGAATRTTERDAPSGQALTDLLAEGEARRQEAQQNVQANIADQQTTDRLAGQGLNPEAMSYTMRQRVGNRLPPEQPPNTGQMNVTPEGTAVDQNYMNEATRFAGEQDIAATQRLNAQQATEAARERGQAATQRQRELDREAQVNRTRRVQAEEAKRVARTRAEREAADTELRARQAEEVMIQRKQRALAQEQQQERGTANAEAERVQGVDQRDRQDAATDDLRARQQAEVERQREERGTAPQINPPATPAPEPETFAQRQDREAAELAARQAAGRAQNAATGRTGQQQDMSAMSAPNVSRETSKPKRIVRFDNPGGRWLEGKQSKAEERMAEGGEGIGAKGLIGSVTGYIGEGEMLPTSLFTDIPGANGEMPEAGQSKYDRLTESVNEKGWQDDQDGNAILVGVNHRGEAFILEGNNRVAKAKELGVPNIKARIQWYNGAEDAPVSALSPQDVEAAAQGQAQPQATQAPETQTTPTAAPEGVPEGMPRSAAPRTVSTNGPDDYRAMAEARMERMYGPRPDVTPKSAAPRTVPRSEAKANVEASKPAADLAKAAEQKVGKAKASDIAQDIKDDGAAVEPLPRLKQPRAKGYRVTRNADGYTLATPQGDFDFKQDPSGFWGVEDGQGGLTYAGEDPQSAVDFSVNVLEGGESLTFADRAFNEDTDVLVKNVRGNNVFKFGETGGFTRLLTPYGEFRLFRDTEQFGPSFPQFILEQTTGQPVMQPAILEGMTTGMYDMKSVIRDFKDRLGQLNRPVRKRMAIPSKTPPQDIMLDEAEVQANKPQIKSALEGVLASMGLTDVDLVLTKLLDPKGFRDQGVVVEGYAETRNGRQLINLATDVWHPSMTDAELQARLTDVLNHEIIHALRASGLLKPKEWDTLTKAVKSRKYTTKAGEKRSYSYYDREVARNSALPQGYQLNEDGIIEEAVAEMFRDAASGRINLAGPPKSIFGRVMDIIKALATGGRSYREQNAGQVFDRIRSGEVGGRQADPFAETDGERMFSRTIAPEMDIEENTILDMNGDPVKMYHGTHKGSRKFDENGNVRLLSGDKRQDTRELVFLTNRKGTANEYALNYGRQAGPVVVEANVAFENPYGVEIGSKEEPDAYWVANSQSLEEKLASGEYDSIMIWNPEGEMMAIATSNDQINTLNNPVSERLGAGKSHRRYSAVPTQGQDLRLAYGSTRSAMNRILSPVMGKDNANAFSDYLYRMMIDKQQTLGESIDQAREDGVELTPDMDTKMQETVSHGVIGEAIRQREDAQDGGIYSNAIGKLELLDMPDSKIDELRNVSGQFRDFEDVAKKEYENRSALGRVFKGIKQKRMMIGDTFLVAKHAKERNAYIKAQNGKENGSGMSDQEASAVMDWYSTLPADQRRALDEFSEGVQDIIKDTNDLRVSSGLIPEGYTTRDNSFQNYVPLRGKVDAEGYLIDDTVGAAGAGTISKKEDPNIFGRDGEYVAQSPLGQAIAQNAATIRRSERNKILQSFAKLAADPKYTGARIIDNLPTMLVKDANGKERSMADTSGFDTHNLIRYKQDGDVKYIHVDDARIGRGLADEKVRLNNAMFQTVNRLNRFLANVNTSWNPEFVISNLFRDVQTAMVNATQYEQEQVKANILGNVPTSLKTARAFFRKGVRATEPVDYTIPLRQATEAQRVARFMDFMKRGGKNVLNTMDDAFRVEDTIRGLMADMGDIGRKPTNLNKAKRMGKKAIDVIEDYNEIAENSTRFSVFNSLMEQGVNPTRAAQAAREVTTNFTAQGEWKTVMNTMYLFYNASLQGSMAMLNAATRSKKARVAMAGLIGLGFMMDQLNALLSDEGEDGNLEYDKLSEYFLSHNFVFPGITLGDNEPASMPLAYGLNLFLNTGRAVSRYMRNGYSADEAIGSIGGTVEELFNPLGGGTPLQFISPTLGDPFVQLMENKNFAGAPIYREKFPGEFASDSALSWSSTPVVYKNIVERVNALTGGTPVKSGLIDINPDTLEHWVDFATGATGATIGRAISAPTSIAQGEDVPLREMPLIRKFAGSITDRDNLTDYIRARSIIQEAEKNLEDAIERRDREGAMRIRENDRELLKLAPVVRNLERRRRQLTQRINEIQQNESMAPERKAELIDRLDEARQRIINTGNRIMGDVR